jgi:hypothetical protein
VEVLLLVLLCYVRCLNTPLFFSVQYLIGRQIGWRLTVLEQFYSFYCI